MLEIGWEDVVHTIQQEERAKTLNPSLFTCDLIASLFPVYSGSAYSLFLDGNIEFSHVPSDENIEDHAKSLILKINESRHLDEFAFAKTGKYEDQIDIFSEKCFSTFPVTASENLVLRIKNKEGGRSRILSEVGRRCKKSFFRDNLFDAQRYLAAHFVVQNLSPAIGRGTMASRSYSGDSISYTMPKNNPQANEGILLTLAGTHYNNLCEAMAGGPLIFKC